MSDSGHFLDQFLGDMAMPATREETLNALRGHVLGTVIAEVEVPGQETPLVHAQGTLVEASRDPGDWEDAAEFALVNAADANAWHSRDELLKAAGHKVPASPRTHFRIPKGCEILAYPGIDAGASGYRIALGNGAQLVIMLWQDVMHVTESGDVAPGMSGFTAEVTDE